MIKNLNFVKKLFFASALIFVTSIYAQGRKSLDNEFGLNQIKLGSNIDQFKDKLKYNWIDEKGTEFYEYTNNDIKFLYKKEVKGIYLAFVDDKLYNITVHFGVLAPKEILELVKILQDNYDIPFLRRGNYLNFAQVWETGKVYMQLEEYSSTSPLDANETQLFWISKSLNKVLKMK
jgi:hypothetical protein